MVKYLKLLLLPIVVLLACIFAASVYFTLLLFLILNLILFGGIGKSVHKTKNVKYFIIKQFQGKQ